MKIAAAGINFYKFHFDLICGLILLKHTDHILKLNVLIVSIYTVDKIKFISPEIFTVLLFSCKNYVYREAFSVNTEKIQLKESY